MLKTLLLCSLTLFAALASHSAPLTSPKNIEVGSYPQEISAAYTTANGLPSDDVRSIAVTDDGEVYAGTSAGLAKWDGKTWETVPGVPGDIHVLLADGDDLYVAAGAQIYRFADKEATLLASGLPSPATALAFDPHRLLCNLLVATNNGLFGIQDGSPTPFKILDDAGDEVTQILDVEIVGIVGHVVIATPTGALALWNASSAAGNIGKGVERRKMRQGQWQRLLPENGDFGWSMISARRIVEFRNDSMYIAAPQGIARRNSDRSWTLFSGADGLPYNDFTAADVAPGGSLWLGTTNGAIHFDGTHWAYRAGIRWLPNNEIRDIAATDEGAWVATAGGVGRIYFKPMTFAEKAEFFESEIDRYGRRTEFEYVNGVHLKKAGDTSEWEQTDTDNDGQYTGLYGAAECLAYGATGSAKAKERATKAFEALAFLSEVTQSGSNPAPPGFISRCVMPTDGWNPNERDNVERDRKKKEGDALWKILDPRWPTSGDGKWYWKTDSSSDELDGHFLMYALYYDHVAETDAEKARVREVTARVADHLIDNDFRLVDHDGTPTRWASFSPASLNGDPDWWTERGLNSLSLLTYLTVAHHVTGDQKYRDVFMDLVDNHHYALNGMVMPKLQFGPGSHVQFDDKMAFMNYYNLIRYEKDPRVLRMFQNSIFYYWQIVRQEKNPFFNFVYAALCEGEGMQTQWGVTDLSPTHNWLEDSVDTLKRFPMDLVLWPMLNSHRIDLIDLGEHTREPGRAKGHGYRVDGYVIPIDERNAISFSEDTWRYDDGRRDGRWLDEGSPFLLGYYLGLYHGYIVE
jgi:hypothetical protein